MFDELDGAESRCNDIKKEIESYYLKTCEVYNDEHPLSVRGVACQTDPIETDLSGSGGDGRHNVLKMKIALVSKRKRGRPVKSQQTKNGGGGGSSADGGTQVRKYDVILICVWRKAKKKIYFWREFRKCVE